MPDKHLTIATFNIHHAEGKGGGIDIKETAAVLREIDADLVALQELDAGAQRTGSVDQPAELADLLGMHIYFAPTLRLGEGEYGIALAARDEFSRAVERLPRVADEEPRVAIAASWHDIGIVTTHLSRSANARKAQTEALADIARKLGTPTVVLGDLNQQAKDLNHLRTAGFTPVDVRSGVSRMLRFRFQIDHILTSRGVSVTKAWTVATEASDHDALVAEIVVEDDA